MTRNSPLLLTLLVIGCHQRSERERPSEPPPNRFAIYHVSWPQLVSLEGRDNRMDEQKALLRLDTATGENDPSFTALVSGFQR